MTGLVLIAVMAFWLWCALRISTWVASRIKLPWFRWAVTACLFAILLVAPLGDEIVGKYQFEALCKKYAVQYVDTEHAMNRKVLYVRRDRDHYADGTAVKLRIDPKIYVDAETGKIVVSYNTVDAKGGWLSRYLGISETNAPLLFSSACGPKDQDAFKEKFNITVIN